MKKLLVLVIMSLLVSVGHSQARLGYSAKDIITEFKGYTMSFGTEEKRYLYVELPTAEVYYNFNAQNICESVYLKPTNLYSFNYYVNRYNEECILLYGNSWVNSSQGVNVYVDLLTSADGTQFFHWHY